MRTQSVLLLLTFALSLLLPAEPRAERGPSTAKERAKALKLVRQLEAEPLGEKSADARRWLALWLLEVPDFQVRYCAEVVGGTPAARQKVRPEILAQIPWSGVAWLIENPDKKSAAKADVYLAGLQGALRSYEALLRVKPDQRSPLLDDLLARRDAGELAGYVAETSQACP